MSKSLLVVRWVCRILVAIILFQTLFFKFSGAEESKYIFSTLMGAEFEAFGRIGSGIVELIAGILILIPKTSWFGAGLALVTISGAIFSHLTILGIEVKNDGGFLFILAVSVFVCSLVVLISDRKNVPLLNYTLRRSLNSGTNT